MPAGVPGRGASRTGIAEARQHEVMHSQGAEGPAQAAVRAELVGKGMFSLHAVATNVLR